MKSLPYALLLVVAFPALAIAQSPAEVGSLVSATCLDCHGGDKPDAGLDLAKLKFDLTDRRTFATWVRVHDKLSAGEMPPPDADQPAPEVRRGAVAKLHEQLTAASLTQQQAEGRVALRRLNRTQHQHALNDLLGVSIKLDDVLPDDGSSAGFDNVAETLEVSSAHLLRYQQAAELALDAAIATRPVKTLSYHRTGKETPEKHVGFLELLGKSVCVDGERLNVYLRLPGHIALHTPLIPTTGRYRLRLSVQALNTGGRPFALQINQKQEDDRTEGRVFATYDLPPDKPRLIEFDALLHEKTFFEVNGWSLLPVNVFHDMRKDQPIEAYTGPGFAFEFMDLEGPLDEFPPASHKRLFGDLPLVATSVQKAKLAGQPPPEIPNSRGDDEWRRDPLIPIAADPHVDAARLLHDFLPRAFRRPVDDATCKYYEQFFAERFNAGAPFHEALRSTYKAILSSPQFFYTNEAPGNLDDFALASRLSLFLWCSVPDETLIALAEKNELHRPEVLRAQVERMLGDAKAERFVENFTGQWLDLRKMNATTPDPGMYGEFDAYLQWSMPQETHAFFREVLARDRSAAEFVHSDWSMLNERLAQHYGIAGVEGGELRRVSLPPESHRGGVLTQASILKVTANGTTTSPILRGKWVLEKLLGTPPAPPPPNLPTIEPDIRGATTIREQLAKHQASTQCAACHKYIDPPGFALESFDVIGGLREFYRASNSTQAGFVKLTNYPERQVWRGLDVELGGVTAEGQKFASIDEYKSLLLEDKEKIARALAKHLVIYATGADVQYADREEIRAIAARTRDRNFGLRSLVHEVVQSRLFLNK